MKYIKLFFTYLNHLIGDGNLHLNITSPTYNEELLHFIEPLIYQWTQQQKGSISAEHGIGFKKTQFIGYEKL